MKEELIEKLREDARIVIGWTVFREDEKQELEQSAYGLYTIAMMLRTFEDKKDRGTIMSLLQNILNRIEYIDFTEFEDRMEQAKVKKDIRDVMFSL